MKGKINYSWIIAAVVLVILFIPIISDYVKNQSIEIITSDVLATKISSKESFLVYAGELDKTTTKELRKMREKTLNDYSYDYGVYNIESNEELKKTLDSDVKLAIIVEGDVQKTYSKYDQSSVDADVEEFLLNNINEKNRSYKVFKDFEEYKKTIKKNEINMIVFGYDGCGYCNRFQPVYNAVASKYNLDIYYFNSNTYDKDEYKKVVSYDIKVPAKCSSDGKEFKLSDGFGTPLTIFTKKGKVVDCIGGYVNRAELLAKLQSVEMISE